MNPLRLLLMSAALTLPNVLSPTPGLAAPVDELDVIRARWVAYLTAADQPAGEAATTAAIARLDAVADDAVHTQQPDGADSPTEPVLGRKLRGKNVPGALTGQNAVWVRRSGEAKESGSQV